MHSAKILATVEPIKITREQYEKIAALYKDAVTAAEGGMGGRHALLVMALNQLGIKVMSWQEANSLNNYSTNLILRAIAPSKSPMNVHQFVSGRPR